MSESIYRWLLRLYPRAFREEYGAAALQLFRDRLNAERGLFARCRLWWDVLGDLAVSIPREHRRGPSVPPPQPGAYRLSEEAVEAMVTKQRRAWLSLAALVLWFVLGWLGDAPRVLLMAGYFLMALVLVAGTTRHLMGARRHLLGLELILGDDRIERKQPGLDLTLQRSEVARVSEVDEGLLVSGPDRRVIWVPSRVNGYAQIREHLARWMPIEREDPRHHELRVKPRHAQTLLFPAYASAVMVRSLEWYIPLALLSGLGLVILVRQAVRPVFGVRAQRGPIAVLLALLAVLVVKAVLLMR